MKCAEMILFAPGGECQCKAKWWLREGPKRPWVPRCGRHALMPPFTKRERVPITEPRPPQFEPAPETLQR